MKVVVNECKDGPGCVFIFMGVNISIIWPVNVDTDLKLIYSNLIRKINTLWSIGFSYFVTCTNRSV